MKSMNNNDNNWLGFSLSPQLNSSSTAPTMEASPPSSDTTQPSSSNPISFYTHFNYPNLYCNGVEAENGGGFYSAFPIMPLKSDGSLCLMEAITKSHSQGMVSANPPKLENFFGGVTMATSDFDRGEATMALSLETSTMYHGHQQHQIQPHHYQDYSALRGLYHTVQDEEEEEVKEAQIAAESCGLHLPSMGEDDDVTGMKNWISRNYHSNGELQSLSLSMSHDFSQSNSCFNGSQSVAKVTDCVVMDNKKRGSEKVDQQKQIVHRKSLDTFGQRTSQFRGVTRHRWTGRYEAHLWDNSCKKEGQSRKGRQVYLGGYDMEEKAARAYDLAALKYWGPSTHINFPLENYEQELEEMKNMSRQEYVAHLRRRSSGFSRGASVYRGVTRHHQHGRWQARIGRVAGNKDLYLGTFSTQEEAAEAYDVAAIKFRGVNAVTNFDMSRYNVERIIASNTLLAGDLARRTKEPTNELLSNHSPHDCQPKTAFNEPVLEWSSDQNPSSASARVGVESHLSNTSSLVTSLSSSREESPERNNTIVTAKVVVNSSGNGWVPRAAATQLRSHIPVFAAWTDA